MMPGGMESPPLISLLIISLLPAELLCGDYTLGMDSETSCTKTHYYKAGDVFTASANGMVHNGRCPLTFIQSGMWADDTVEPCLSLCVKIVSYTMESCNIEMAYHDGVDDYTPVMFDCHTFPPVMWCSSKNDLKVTVSESKNYRGKDYSITLEVKPFCGVLDGKTTDAGVVAIRNEEPKVMNKTALIVGAIVGTVSILFVLGWILYCYKKRRNEEDMMGTDRYQQDRRYRSTTPNQQTNRYAPVGLHVPASSQSSSDHGVLDPYHSLKDPVYPGSMANTDVKRPYHDALQPQLSNQSHVTGKDPWYHMSPVGQGFSDVTGPPASQQPFPQQPFSQQPFSQQPPSQTSQYLLQNKVYNYPQFNGAENPPSDTRFVVYDFDYPAPVQRKYSGGKFSMGHSGDSPVKEIDRMRSRELTPNRDRQRGMPPIDSTTTDHTSDNDDSSYSVTTEDETTTDDQMSPVKGHMYNMAPPPFGYGAMINRDANVRFYNHSNFQPVQRNTNPPMRDERMNTQTPVSQQSGRIATNEPTSFSNNTTKSVSDSNAESSNSRKLEPKEGPMPQVPSPQVPPLPRSMEKVTQKEELPWPHNPPPAYSQTDSGDSDGAQII